MRSSRMMRMNRKKLAHDVCELIGDDVIIRPDYRGIA